MYFFNLCRSKPELTRQGLIKLVREQLGPDYDVATHFTPTYDPWDQRLCLVPDGDLFKAIRTNAKDYNELLRFTKDIKAAYFKLYYDFKMAQTDDPTLEKIPVKESTINAYKAIEDMLPKNIGNELKGTTQEEIFSYTAPKPLRPVEEIDLKKTADSKGSPSKPAKAAPKTTAFKAGSASKY